MNLLSHLPFLNGSKDEAPEAEFDYDSPEAKKERIDFHREKVRNGPVKFTSPTNGQIRRFEKRVAEGRTKKARRHQVRMHLLQTQEAAVLRGQLQMAGLVPYAGLHVIDPVKQVRATVWIIDRFGEDGEHGRKSFLEPDVRAALQSALNRYEALHGQPTSELDPDFVTPIYAEFVA